MNKNILIFLIFSLFFLFIFFKSSRTKIKENFSKKVDEEIINNKSICVKKHLDAYVNCILLDFEMYSNQNRDWNKKWKIDCKDSKDKKCETVKTKSKRECKIPDDDEYMQEFVNLQHNVKMPYHVSEYAKTHCLKPDKDMMNEKNIISTYINRIDTEVDDSSKKINLLGAPNKNKLSKLYKESIQKIKEEIDNIDYSKADKN